MARPSKYNWEEIRHGYECGMTIDSIVKKYGVTKKTLENKISLDKWSVMGEVKSAINELSDSFGRVSGVQEKFPEKAHIIADEISERTKHLQFINNLTLKNLSVMAKKVNEDTSINEHKMIGETVHKAGQTLGVIDQFAPKIELNNTNAQQNNITEIVGYKVKTIE
jgi:hypothetical protein